MTEKLLLIDGHGLAYRGFYALPETLTAPDGTPTNAIVGFTNMLTKCIEEQKADYIGLFFDPKGPTHRHSIYKEYKDGRKPTPDNFKVQIPLIIDLCEAMGIPVFVKENTEADDYIISTAKAASSYGVDVTILTADKDMFQAISDNISILRPIKGVSKFKRYDKKSFFEEFGFSPTKMSDYLALVGDSSDNIIGVKGIGEKGAKELVSKYGDLDAIYSNLDNLTKARKNRLLSGRETAYMSKRLVEPIFVNEVPLKKLKMKKVDHLSLEDLCNKLGLKKLYAQFKKPKTAVSSDLQIQEKKNKTEVQIEIILKNEDLAVTLCEDNESEILLLADREGNFSYLLQENKKDFDAYQDWLKQGRITLYGYRNLLEKSSFPLTPSERINDVEIVHYLLHPDRSGAGIEKTINKKLPEGIELVFSLFDLWDFFVSEIDRKNPRLNEVLREIDLPLCSVLAELHKTGILVNLDKLKKLEKELKEDIKAVEESISSISTEKINLNSPKQVANLLFDELRLPPIKKTATGFSTDMSVLEELAKMPKPLSDVPIKLIEYREKTKVASGFVEPFLKLAEIHNGKIHSTFDHLSTGTGRLSSRDPNVQNLPQFGALACKFRECFIPSEGKIFVAADYSQIELRVLAHLSKEQKLITSFNEDKDIHKETASLIFSLPEESITQEERRFAKVVNFGLLYGMGVYGLSQRLGITRMAASDIVKRYFKELPSVKRYLEESVKEAIERGYTESLFGRIRPLNELSTIEGRDRNSINRVALNTPIQSTASDIAKIALIRFQEVIDKKYKNVNIVLQVHDSIVCECNKEDSDRVEQELLKVMESVNILSVPIKAVPKRGFSLNDV